MDNIVEKKSFDFAVRIVKLYKHLSVKKREQVFSKQVLRSGTSVGANIAEAQQAQSKADFVSKMNIALKEITETKYWINLLTATNYLTEKEQDSIREDCIEIEKLLVRIIKTAKQ